MDDTLITGMIQKQIKYDLVNNIINIVTFISLTIFTIIISLSESIYILSSIIIYGYMLYRLSIDNNSYLNINGIKLIYEICYPNDSRVYYFYKIMMPYDNTNYMPLSKDDLKKLINGDDNVKNKILEFIKDYYIKNINNSIKIK